MKSRNETLAAQPLGNTYLPVNTNLLVPIQSVVTKSNTPTYKTIVVTLAPALEPGPILSRDLVAHGSGLADGDANA